MPIKNRIKCAASIDVDGTVLLGAAKPGFRALAISWATTDGEYQYLLEDAIDPTIWELGRVHIRNGASVTFGSKQRQILDSSSGVGFANSAAGLVFSQVALVCNVWAGGTLRPNLTAAAEPLAAESNMAAGPGARATSPYTAGGIALGADAIATGDGDVAIGYGAQTKLGAGVAIGKGATSSYSGEVALGGDYLAASVHFQPMKSVLYAAGTAPFTTCDAFNPTLNYATWKTTNRKAGPLRFTGRVAAGVAASGMAGATITDFDYTLWVDATSCTVVGTPVFTNVFTGVSAVPTTFSVDATTGGLKMTATAAGYVIGRALARIDNLAF